MKVLKKILMYSLLILLLLQLYGFYVSYKAMNIIDKPYKTEYFDITKFKSRNVTIGIEKTIHENNFTYINPYEIIMLFESIVYNSLTDLKSPYIYLRIVYYNEKYKSNFKEPYLWSISEGRFVKWE